MIYFIGSTTPLFNDRYTKSTFEDCLSYFQDKEFIEVDTETTGLDPHGENIICIQLGDPENQFVIEWLYADIDKLKEFFSDSNKTFIFQNAKFDLKFLMKYDIYPEKVYDTMLVEKLLYCGLSNVSCSLKSIVLRRCGYDLDKSVRAEIGTEGLTDRVIIYSALDVTFLTKIREQQIKEVEKWELEKVVDLENEVVKVFAKMEYDGIHLDMDKLLEVSAEIKPMIEEVELKLNDIIRNTPSLSKFVKSSLQMDIFGNSEADIDVNWSSPAQKLEILNLLGLDVSSVGEEVISKIRNEHPIIPLLLDYSKKSKLYTAFGPKYKKYINPITGRVHYDINQILNTGRIATSSPNINQVPSKGLLAKKIRNCFTAIENHKIVGGDYSGAELCLMAEFSQDSLWIDTINSGGDLHSVLCSKTFNIPIENVRNPFPAKPDLTYRDVQKSVNFGLSYGMTEHRLSGSIGVSKEEAKEVIDKFFKGVPKIKRLLDKFERRSKNRGYIRTYLPYRRIRFFESFRNKNIKGGELSAIGRAGKNAPVQGSNGDMIKLALINVYNEIRKNNYPVKIILAVYDEINCEVHEDFAEEWRSILEKIMLDSAGVIVKNVKIKADCSIEPYWTK